MQLRTAGGKSSLTVRRQRDCLRIRSFLPSTETAATPGSTPTTAAIYESNGESDGSPGEPLAPADLRPAATALALFPRLMSRSFVVSPSEEAEVRGVRFGAGGLAAAVSRCQVWFLPSA